MTRLRRHRGESSGRRLSPADDGGVAATTRTAPRPRGLRPTGDELAARMDAYLAANFPRAGAPGLAVAVVDAGGVRYLRTFGDCPDADAPFVVGSLSKSFTAVAVMQLVEQGAVDLDAPASRYAPGYDVPDEVTVRSLLNQTSGFGAYDSLAEAADGELGETFGAFSYANANYDLLGRVVEGASGEDYARYLDEHVLEPLGMASTTADPARAEALGMAPGHRDWFGLITNRWVSGMRRATTRGAAPRQATWRPACGIWPATWMYLKTAAWAATARARAVRRQRGACSSTAFPSGGDTYYGGMGGRRSRGTTASSSSSTTGRWRLRGPASSTARARHRRGGAGRQRQRRRQHPVLRPGQRGGRGGRHQRARARWTMRGPRCGASASTCCTRNACASRCSRPCTDGSVAAPAPPACRRRRADRIAAPGRCACCSCEGVLLRTSRSPLAASWRFLSSGAAFRGATC